MKTENENATLPMGLIGHSIAFPVSSHYQSEFEQFWYPILPSMRKRRDVEVWKRVSLFFKFELTSLSCRLLAGILSIPHSDKQSFLPPQMANGRQNGN